MERKAVIIPLLIVLSLGLVAVPAISLLREGCRAGTRGLLDWLPEWDGSPPSDRSCEAVDLLSEGYQALCPPREHGAIQKLLDTIGFFGPSTQEPQELAICVYGKSAWSWLKNGLTRGRDATVDLHRSATSLVKGNSISWQTLKESFLEMSKDGTLKLGNLLQEMGSNVAQPFLKIPQQFNDQYFKLWEFYHNVRASRDQWTSGYSNNTIVAKVTSVSGAIKNGNWKHVKRGYLLPAWQYITCDNGKPQTTQSVFKMVPVEPTPFLQSGSGGQRSVTTSETPQGTETTDSSYAADWRIVTRSYVAKLMNFLAKSVEATKESREEVDLQVEESGEIHSREENSTLIETNGMVVPEEVGVVEADTPAEENPGAEGKELLVPVAEDAYTRAVKKVLFESLIATVLAFALFILVSASRRARRLYESSDKDQCCRHYLMGRCRLLVNGLLVPYNGVALNRVVRSRLLGFQWPSLVRAVVSRYKPVRLIKEAEDFNTFHMVCKRTRQNVAVKCLQVASTSSARTDFSTELHSLRRLKHPNVVTLLDCIRSGPSFCLGLEYAPYGSLRSAACNPSKTFGFEQKVAVYKQILEAVNWMHKSGWAHLNIRPGTILVFDKWSQVKLSGFTAAVECFKRELCHNYDLHPMCSSPYVITRQPYEPKKADLWALGCLLYFIFTQKEVHSHEGALRLARVVCRMDYERQPSSGLNLIKLLADLLSFHPGNRPALCDLIDIVNNLA